MKRFLIFLGLILSMSLLANHSSLISIENDPSTIVDGKVSAITGDPVIFQNDLVIQGVEPIHLTRAYISGLKSSWWQGGMFGSLYPIDEKTWVLTERNGAPISYRKKDKQKIEIDQQKYYRYEPINLIQGFSNTSHGKISSRTNLKNNYLLIDENYQTFILHAADGTIRTCQPCGNNQYKLISEQLPNGNWVLYDYDTVVLDKKNKETLTHIKSIRTTNPKRTKTYAKVEYLYEDPKHKNQHHFVKGSDGQGAEYCYEEEEKPHRGSLHVVASSDFPNQTFDYMKFTPKYSKFKGDVEGVEECRLKSIKLPLNRSIGFDYYKNDTEWVAGQSITMDEYWIGSNNPHFDPRRSRVKEISSQVGGDIQSKITHSFIYDLKNQKTSVYEIDGNRVDYFWDSSSRVHKIEWYTKDNKLLKAEEYIWSYSKGDHGNLICKIFKDSNGIAIFSKRYFYDSRGNILEERIYGNLSGQGSPLSYDKSGAVEGGEYYAKRFKYSTGEPNLLLEESEDSGLRIVYEYLPNTDLTVSQTTYDNQNFKYQKLWQYNQDRILIREITNDGYRKTIRQITPLDSGPFIGMPSIIEEKYEENKVEQLLRKTLLTYGKGARISQKDIYDADGQFRYSLKMDYDEKGRLIRETNPLGQEQTYAYDECGNRILSKDFSGKIIDLVEYDYSNRPIRLKKQGNDGIVLETRLSYDLKHHLVLEVNSQGHETKHNYDLNGFRIETSLPEIPDLSGNFVSTTHRKAYDSAGNVIQETDAEGNVTQSTYNAYGKPTRILHPDGAVEEYVYNLDGTVKTYSDPKGVVTSYIYDGLGRILRKTVASAQESYEYSGLLLASKIDAEGNRTTFSYDGAGRKIAEELEGEEINYSYDSLGRLSKVQRNSFCTISEYDLLDRVIEERVESNSGQLLRKTRFEYDSAGNRKTILRYIAGKEAQESFAYDSLKRLILKSDALGNTETISYNQNHLDDYGKKVLQKVHTDPMGLQTVETFNAQNHLAKIEKRKEKTLFVEEKFYNRNGLLNFQINTIFAPNGTSRKINTRWDYDNRGRLSSLTEAYGTSNAKTTLRDYTLRGELYHMIKPDGTTLTYDYNDLGHLIFLSSSDGTIRHEMNYDKLGQLIWDGGITTIFNAHGRPLSETFPQGYALKNRYDLDGKRIESSIPTADCLLQYEYNPLDLQRIVRKSLNGMELYAHEYKEYDLSGNLLEEKLINLNPLFHSVDPLSRKTAISTPSFSQEVLAFDPVGNILQMRLQQDTLSYTYDELYQLTSETGSFSHNYSYDSLNNRLEKDGETYQINDLHQVISHLEYDKNGNPIQSGDTRYTYDALDRLIRVETPNLLQIYTYDSQHRCLSKTTCKDGTQKTRYFLYDGRKEIGSFDEYLNLIDLRILGLAPHAEIGAAIAVEFNNKVYAPIHDLQGNLASLLPLQEGSTTFYRYSAFGEERMTRGEISPWRYSSKRTDENTGLVNFGRRFYMPEFGRWLTPDPAGFTDGMNLYAFVHNDPLTNSDEYGLITYDYRLGWVNCPWGSDYSWNAPRYNQSSLFPPKGEDARMLRSDDPYPRGTPNYYVNGILNTRSDSRRGAQALLRTYGNQANIIPFYSESFGIAGDLASVWKSITAPNYSTFATRRLERELRSHCHFLDSLNDPRKIFITAFSRGSTDTYHGAKNLTPQQKDRLMITTCGPIMILPRSLGHKVTNLVSRGDWCSLRCNPGLIEHLDLYERNANVFLLLQKDWEGANADHFFLSKTYQYELKERSVDDYKKFGILR